MGKRSSGQQTLSISSDWMDFAIDIVKPLISLTSRKIISALLGFKRSIYLATKQCILDIIPIQGLCLSPENIISARRMVIAYKMHFHKHLE